MEKKECSAVYPTSQSNQKYLCHISVFPSGNTECDLMKIQVHLLVLRLRKCNIKSDFSLQAAAHFGHVLFQTEKCIDNKHEKNYFMV